MTFFVQIFKPSMNFFGSELDEVKDSLMTAETLHDHLITNCNHGIERAQIIHKMARALTTNPNQIWIKRDGSIDLSKLKKEISMTEDVSKRLLNAKGFVKLSDLHFVDREGMIHWSSSHDFTIWDDCAKCKQAVKQFVFSPTVSLALKRRGKFRPDECPELYNEELTSVVNMSPYERVNIAPNPHLRTIEIMDVPISKKLPPFRSPKDLERLNAQQILVLQAQFEKGIQSWDDLTLEMQISFNQALEKFELSLRSFTSTRMVSSSLQEEEIDFFVRHLYKPHTPSQTKFMFEFSVSPYKCRTALESFELPNIDLESIELGTLSKAQTEWCFLIIRKKQPLLSSARQEAFALRFKELGMCQPLESWEAKFGKKEEVKADILLSDFAYGEKNQGEEVKKVSESISTYWKVAVVISTFVISTASYFALTYTQFLREENIEYI